MASPAPATTQQPPPLDVDDLLKCGTSKPLPFVVTDENGMFYVDPDTAKIIAAINKPLVVVSIVGRYRTGKSFFMNRLAGSNTGFSLGRTIKAQTKGIWVWPRPHPDNDKYLLLLDTEGLGDVHKGDEHHDMWIFVMAVLMSTTLVWNIMGVLDHQSFEQLNFITNMTEHVQAKKTQTENEQKSGLHNYFPNFIVCIRDFTLELEINLTACTSDEYLEDCLNAPELENLRKQREMLRTCFKNRKCFVFKRPVEEELINKLENVPDDKLRPAFLDTANQFKEYVLQTSTVKQIDSITLTGPSFLTLVEEYVSKSNNPNFKLCIESTLTHVVNTSNKRAKDEAIDIYSKKMESVKTRFPLPVQEFCNLHEDCFKNAMELFNQNSVLDREKTHIKELKDNLEAQYRNWTIENKNKSQEKCDMTLKELYEPIKAKEVDFLTQGSIKDYYDMMNELKLKYRKMENVGDEKNNVLLAFIDEKETMVAKILEKNASIHQEYKKEIEDLKNESIQLIKKHDYQQFKITSLEEQVKSQTERIEQLQENIHEVEEKNEKLTSKIFTEKEKNGKLTSEIFTEKEKNEKLTSEIFTEKEKNEKLTSEIFTEKVELAGFKVKEPMLTIAQAQSEEKCVKAKQKAREAEAKHVNAELKATKAEFELAARKEKELILISAKARSEETNEKLTSEILKEKMERLKADIKLQVLEEERVKKIKAKEERLRNENEAQSRSWWPFNKASK